MLIPPLLLIGCGRMGNALLRGWEAQGLSSSVVVDPGAAVVPPPHLKVDDASLVPVSFKPEIVILAVKPQTVDAILPLVVPFVRDAIVLSIMAGRSISGLASALGGDVAIVRAMPNTPAAIGRGITVACAGPGVRAPQRELCARLLAAAGAAAWVENEALLDPVTALSGSGPAYVFLLAELLEAAGIEQGLPPALARQLARLTVSGAGALLDASPDEDACALRRAVTSSGGTTASALDILMGPTAWPASIPAAIEAATQRSRALAR